MTSSGYRLTALIFLHLVLISGVASAADKAVAVAPFDIPRLESIIIDGRGDDWAERGFKVEVLTQSRGALRPVSDIDGSLRLGWNDQGLVLLATVRDDAISESDDVAKLWQRDALELFMADAVGGADFAQFIIASGVDGKNALRQHSYDNRSSAALRKAPLEIIAAAKPIAGGYLLEAMLPWSNFAIVPKIGRELGFNAQIDDADPGRADNRLTWFPREGAWNSSAMMMALRLAEQPSAPVRAIANAVSERLTRSVVTVVGTADLAGKSFRISDGTRELGRGALTPDASGRTRGEILLPFAGNEKGFGPLVVQVETQRTLEVSLPDLASERAEALKDDVFAFHPAVFNGAVFPACEALQPNLLEELIGRYTITVAFYDASYQPVSVPTKPGRYGAVVDAIGSTGSIRRVMTLFCAPEKADWKDAAYIPALHLPKGFGIAPESLDNQPGSVKQLLARLMRDSVNLNEKAAITLAWLYESLPGAPEAVDRTGPDATQARWMVGLRKAIGDLALYRHVLVLPDGYDADPRRSFPLIVSLHGSGAHLGSFEEFEQMVSKPDPRTKTDFPCIVLTPRCPDNERNYWDPTLVNLLIDEVISRYRIDPARIYLTGYSLGAYGVYETAMETPQRFAALVPIAGAGDLRDVGRIKDVPTWIFHGAHDEAVPLRETTEMAAALQAIGASPRVTIYPDEGHGIAGKPFAEPEFLPWLFQQSRSIAPGH